MRSIRSIRFGLGALLGAGLLTLVWPTSAFAPPSRPVERVSVSTAGAQQNAESFDNNMTPDGRFIVFDSIATNLVAGDTNARRDVFIRDRLLGTTELVSVGVNALGNAVPADLDSRSPNVSDDGRYVAFESNATNLVAGDTNGFRDIFVRDIWLGKTLRVSVSSTGGQANQHCFEAEISGDGTVVGFSSAASNIVATDPSHGDLYGGADVFVRDLETNTNTLVSDPPATTASDDDSTQPSLSYDGRYVAFSSHATVLVTGDTNGVSDVFRFDRVTGALIRVSITSAEAQATGLSREPSISGDGQRIAFTSSAANLALDDFNTTYDVFVRYLDDGRSDTLCASMGWSTHDPANGMSVLPSIASDGTYVAYVSEATDLVSGDTNAAADVFVSTLDEGIFATRISLTSTGAQLTADSSSANVSDRGRVTSFSTQADNVTPEDTNGTPDVFVSTGSGFAWIEHDAGGVTFDRWVTGYSASYTGGGYVYSRWANTSLEAAFHGTRVVWYGPRQPGYGMAEVYLDGVSKGVVDCYAAAASASLHSPIWTSDVLDSGPHTLRIRLTGTKNAASTGTVVVVDHLGVVISNPLGPVKARLNEQGHWATFAGTWIWSTNPTYYGKNYSYSRWSGPVYTASFYGTKVAWIGPMVNNYGKAQVFIDGALKGTVDCYAPTTATGWRYKIWESAVLPRGSHYIYIKPTGTKRVPATNTVVVVDALDVTP